MARNLTKDDEILVRKGASVSCPACGNFLAIENKDLDDGSKSRSYRCLEDGCKEYSGSVLLPWYQVVFNLITQRIVAISIVILVAVTGYVTTAVTGYFENSEVAAENISTVYDDLSSLGCVFGDDMSAKRKSDQAILCVEIYLEELELYREDIEWAKQQKSKNHLHSYLQGKAKIFNTDFTEVYGNDETQSGLKKDFGEIVAFKKGKQRGLWEGNKMVDTFCTTSNCDSNISDSLREVDSK